MSNCKNFNAFFSVSSEMEGTTNRNPLPTKDLPDVFGEFFHTNLSKIRESFNNDSDSDTHNVNEVCLINNEI